MQSSKISNVSRRVQLKSCSVLFYATPILYSYPRKVLFAFHQPLTLNFDTRGATFADRFTAQTLGLETALMKRTFPQVARPGVLAHLC